MKVQGLLNKNYEIKTTIEKEDIFTYLLFIINAVLLCLIMQSNNQIVMLLASFTQLIVNSIWFIVYCVVVKFKLNFIPYLDEKGKEYAEKLRFSKRYLKQYTLINDRTVESEIVFGTYIRNAIFFDLKGLLDKNAKEYYVNEISKYGYTESKKTNFITNLIIFTLVYGMWVYIFIVSDFVFRSLLANIMIYPLIFLYFFERLYPENRNMKK